MGGELLLALDEQREHVDERRHLGGCVRDLRHPCDREPDLVLGLQRAYGPLELQAAVSARACPERDAWGLRDQLACVEVVLPGQSLLDVLEDRPRIGLAANLVWHVALLNRLKPRATGLVPPLVHDLEESSLGFARVRG